MAPDGSIVIATGNDDALGLYTCTPYNSYGTAGASAPTRVLLKVREGGSLPSTLAEQGHGWGALSWCPHAAMQPGVLILV